MRTAIFYYTGTGNSLYVAKRIKNTILESEIYPIVKFLGFDNIKIEEEKLVIVFPIYALTIPIPVRIFLSKISSENIKYISVIATRLGLYFDDFSRIDKILKKKKMKIDSHFLINMPSNDIKVKGFKRLSENNFLELKSKANEKIEMIVKIINDRKTYLKKDNDYLEALPYGDFRDKLLLKIIPKMMTFSKWIGGVNYFYVSSNCNGCGLCQKVCLSTKISIENFKPKWNKKVLCYMCYACVNFCPNHAIEIESIPGVKSYSIENDRYYNPNISIKEIENQK